MSSLYAVRLFAIVLLLSGAAAMAQSGTMWDKTYSLSASPTLTLEVGDSNLRVHPCSACRTVHIHVNAEGIELSSFNLAEEQNGNTIRFSLKQKPGLGFHLN